MASSPPSSPATRCGGRDGARIPPRLHDFSESIEHALTAMILVGLGAAMPMLWPHLDWSHISIALLLSSS
jgi:hypothetical protein